MPVFVYVILLGGSAPQTPRSISRKIVFFSLTLSSPFPHPSSATHHSPQDPKTLHEDAQEILIENAAIESFRDGLGPDL